jgi:D-alanyl-D-alanine dipeptidase
MDLLSRKIAQNAARSYAFADPKRPTCVLPDCYQPTVAGEAEKMSQNFKKL